MTIKRLLWASGSAISVAILFGLKSREHTTSLPDLPLHVESRDDCLTLKLSNASLSGYIKRAGEFCLVEDFLQESRTWGGHPWPGHGHALIRMMGGHIQIDLQGHTLTADSHSHGIIAYSRVNQGFGEREMSAFGRETVHLVVRNGYIDLRSFGKGVDFRSDWSSPLEDAPPHRPQPYQKTRHVLENLVIRTEGLGIVLEGEGNIIRNCVIESEGEAAVVVIGPNNIVENNRIILAEPGSRRKGLSSFFSRKPEGAKGKPNPEPIRTAILLREASGTRVSGNTIEVAGPSETRHAVYVRDASKDVVIEGNRMTGVSKAAWIDANVTLVERNNQVPGK